MYIESAASETTLANLLGCSPSLFPIKLKSMSMAKYSKTLQRDLMLLPGGANPSSGFLVSQSLSTRSIGIIWIALKKENI